MKNQRESFQYDRKYENTNLYHSLASSSSCVTSDGGVKYPASLKPLSRKPILPNFVLKLARALSTGTENPIL